MLGDEEKVCPVTLQSFIHPVVAEDGHVYERSAIEAWFARNQRTITSPVTGFPMGQKLIVCPLLLKALNLELGTQHSVQHDEKPLPSVFARFEDLLVELKLDPAEEERFAANAAVLRFALNNSSLFGRFDTYLLDARVLATAINIAVSSNHKAAIMLFLTFCDEQFWEADLWGYVLEHVVKSGHLFAFHLLTAKSNVVDDDNFFTLYVMAANYGQSQIMVALSDYCESWKGEDVEDFMKACCRDAAVTAIRSNDIQMLDCVLNDKHCGQTDDWLLVLQGMELMIPIVGADSVKQRQAKLKALMTKHSTSTLSFALSSTTLLTMWPTRLMTHTSHTEEIDHSNKYFVFLFFVELHPLESYVTQISCNGIRMNRCTPSG